MPTYLRIPIGLASLSVALWLYLHNQIHPELLGLALVLLKPGTRTAPV